MSRKPSSPRDGVSPLEWPREAGTVEPVLRAVEHHVRRRRRLRLLGAGAALAVLCLATLSWRDYATATNGAVDKIAATASVRAPVRQKLPDGSIVEYERGTAIDIHYSATHRRITLREGAAHFAVMKDSLRPFVVEAAGFAVRAVGTEFVVELGGTSVDVLVTEGRVRVAELSEPGATVEPAGEPGRSASVVAGERIVLPVATREIPARPESVTAEEVRERLAWRVPRLEFSGAPLRDVIALFNEHAPSVGGPRLRLADPSLEDLPLSGVLRADNTSVLVAIVESSYGLKSREGAAGELELFRP